jgi:hypothetical protein
MTPDLQMLIAEIEASQSHAESIVHGLSREQFNWRAEPGRWSIAQCILHLNICEAMDLAPLREAIEEARRRGKTGEGPFTYGLLVRKFVESMEPSPTTRKVKAPAVYIPPEEAEPAATFAEFKRIHGELRRITESADGLHLSKVKTKMPALPAVLRPLMRFPLGARLLLITTHDRRHLMQAEGVRNHPEFPG